MSPEESDEADKLLIAFYMIDLFRLDIFDKGCSKKINFLNFCIELETDDYDRYRLNTIVEIGVETERNARTYLNSSEFRIPLTMTYIGISDSPIGIRI